MASIKEYLNETANFNRRVEIITEFLNKSSIQLKELISLLEKLFDALKRSNNLINFLKNYSQTFETQMVKMGEELTTIKEKIIAYQTQLSFIEQITKQTRSSTDAIEENAHKIIKLARMITYLAENIEVKAYQSRDEGKGLAVIARETYKVAKSSELLFRHFDELLEVIRKNVEPFSSEIDATIKDASASSKDLIDFLSSLKSVSESIDLLKKFIGSIEKGSEIFSEVETKINESVKNIQKQLGDALYTVDEISIKSSEITNLSQILYEIYNIVNFQQNINKNPYASKQLKYLLSENLRILKKINIGTSPSLLPQELLTELHYIINQVNKLYELILNNTGEVENLNSIMNKISSIKMDINQIFSNRSMIIDKIADFKKLLKEQLLIIENLIEVGSKIIAKLKTLAVFSKLEKSHSIQYKELIAPIITEFNQLLIRMTSSFNALESGVAELKTTLSRLDALYLQKDFVHLTLPDFSRIKIFYADTLRVFETCFLNMKNLKGLINNLDKDNFLLKQHWNVYEEALFGVLNFQSYLQNLLSEKETVPHFVKSQNAFTINLFNDPVTLKPDLKTDATSQQVIVNYSTGLFQFGFGTGVIPGLCDEYTMSEDGREYTLHIREDLKYANGRRLHIEDIKVGILKGLNGPNRNLLEMIAGARDYLQSRDENLLWVKVLDQNRIKIKLKYPYLAFFSSFATNIADPYIDGELPVGMGPFKLLSWDRGKELILEANDFYYEGRPGIDILKFLITVDDDLGYELFKSGELSIYQPGLKFLQRVKQEFPELVITMPELSIQFLCFHCQKPPFNNKLVRQAISCGINVEKFVNDLLFERAIPAKGVFPPSMPVYNKRLGGYKYDPSRSRQLLSQAGFSAGLPDRYPLLVSDTVDSIRRAEFIKSNLNEIGVRVEINPLPWHDFLENCYKGNFLLCLQGWISDTGDPDNFLYPLFHTKSFGYTGNTFFFSNSEIDEMIDNARQIRNIKQRIKYYQEIEEKIIDEAPGVFLFHSLKTIVVKKGVRGFKPHPLSIIRAKYIQSIMSSGNREILSERLGPRFVTV